MSRPESIKNIKEDDRFVRIAMFEIDKIVASAPLLKHYTALLEAVQKVGGRADKSYNTVNIEIPKTPKELEYQLDLDQRSWDELQKFYNLALNRGPTDTDIPEWRRSSIKSWAKEEGLPDPFDVFAANNQDIQQIREDMGLEN